MKSNYLLIILSVLLVLGSGCSEFDDINTNPDNPNNATAALLATKLIGHITKPSSAKVFSYDYMISKHMAWSEGAQNEQYNLWGRTSFGKDTLLINTVKMVEYAEKVSNVEPYAGLAHFVKAYRLFYNSLEVGDIPYSEALQGESGNVKPKYDTQKDVMLNILNDLDKAYDYFSKATGSFEGDFIYGGNVENWKKTVTAFQLKVLMNLSIKESDTDLNIKKRFSEIVSQRELYRSNNDNLQINFKNAGGMVYPFHHTETKHAQYVMLSTTLVDTMKKYNDYRLFYYASPAKAQTNAGISADSWDAYLGIDPSLAFSDISSLKSEEKYCALNPRYTENEVGESLIRLGFGEQQLILAEAVLRGWISGSASDYYKKGIKAGFDFVKAQASNNVYNNGREITTAYIEDYLNNPLIQLDEKPSSFESDLNKILTQKYLASFLQYPMDSYYDYRRTGYPRLPINPGTNQNTVADKMPVRYMYPLEELNYNKENCEASIQQQYGGDDNVNSLMWILKE